jgi:AAA15 family ATPase/GTPase
MISSFEIKNFRCFHHSKATGITRINLFAGRNNAGKTALLEALLLMGKPSNQSIANLLSYRRVSKKFIKEMPESAWENFFYHKNKKKTISFNFALDSGAENKVIINCDEKTDDFVSLVTENTDQDMLAFARSLDNTNVKSSLHIGVYIGESQLSDNIFISSPNGIAGRGISHTFFDTHFVPAFKLDSDELATEFDKAKLKGDSNTLLEAFQIIDSTIEKVETFKIGEAALYLKRKGEDYYMPLSFFGDAMNRIADFILRIVNNKNSLLLVDEIENGIHYENQEEIWKILFNLCEKYNVQLFATSHSYEMIEAYKNVIIKNHFQEIGSYFEMARHSAVPSKITIQKIPIYSLEDKINHQNPIRGEQTNKRRLS